MFVKVKIIDTEGNEKGRAYTYESDIDVEIGEKVIADMAGSDKVLKVVGFALPEEFENVDFEIKKIKSVYTGEADSDGVLPDKTIDISIEEESLPVIRFNFDDLKTELGEMLSKYNGLVVTEQSLSGCKAMQKELASLRIKIDTYRKDKKKSLSAPIVFFEEQCKELIALVEKAETPIKDGIKVFDDKKKDGKRNKAVSIIAGVVSQMELNEKYAARLDVLDRYCNLTATETEIKNDVESRALALKVEQDREAELLEIIRMTIDSENERLKTKLNIIDFSRFIIGGTPTAEILAEVKAQANRIYEAENRPIEVAPAETVPEVVAEIPKEEEQQTLQTQQRHFAVYRIEGSVSELMGVSAYLKNAKISYTVEDQGEL